MQKSKIKNDMAVKRAKPANKPVNKKSIKDSESKSKIVKTSGNKNKSVTLKKTKAETSKSKEAVKTSENKTNKKPQVSQNTNPFVDRYLEFYDDIKIPSRRYDW